MTAITFPRPGLTPVPTQEVCTRAAWADSWTIQENLWCQRLTLSTGETLSAATFRWRYGYEWPADGGARRLWPVASINPLSYVKVTITPDDGRDPVTWIGVWRAATKADVHQTFNAVGLEALLDLPLRDVPYWDGTDVQWAGRGLEFDANGLPNRSAARHTVNGVSTYVFEPNFVAASKWSTQDAVCLILALGAPLDPAESPLFDFEPYTTLALPEKDEVRLETHGQTYLSLLRALVSRHRSVGWVCEPTGDDTPRIRFFSYLADALELRDHRGLLLETIPANSYQDTLDVSSDTSGTCTISTSASQLVDQVVVTGRRRQSVWTAGNTDAAFDYLWTDADAATLLAGPVGPDFPPAGDIYAREEWLRTFRASPQFRAVFADFGPRYAWEQTAGDGEGGIDPLNPIFVDDDGNQVLGYWPELLLSEHLPLQTGYDHSGTKISDRENLDGYHAEEIVGSTHETLPLLTWVKIFTGDGVETSDRWCRGDQVGKAADLEKPDLAMARTWTVEARPLGWWPGVACRVSGEEQQILAAAETIVAADVKRPGAITWQTDLLLTVAADDLRDVEVRYPADDDVTPQGDLIRRLYVEDHRYRLVRVLPGTVVGVDPETHALIRTDGGILIDDRGPMMVLARRLYDWHRQWRYAAQITTGYVDGAVAVGHLLTTLDDPSGSYTLNTVITELSYEFPPSASPTPIPPRCAISTSHAEMDFRAGGL